MIDFRKIRDRFFAISYNSVGHLRIYLSKTTHFEMHWPLVLERYSFFTTFDKSFICNYITFDCALRFVYNDFHVIFDVRREQDS